MIFFLLISAFANPSGAAVVATCQGTLDWDSSPVSAQVFLENGRGRLVIQSRFDQIESPTALDVFGDRILSVFNNRFQMEFTVAPDRTARNVQAFRNGEFFVDDFECKLSL